MKTRLKIRDCRQQEAGDYISAESSPHLHHINLIQFINHPCNLSTPIAIRLRCHRLVFAFTKDLKTESHDHSEGFAEPA